MNKVVLLALLGTSLFASAARAETKSTGKTATSASKSAAGSAGAATAAAKGPTATHAGTATATSPTKSTTATPVGGPPSSAAPATPSSAAPATPSSAAPATPSSAAPGTSVSASATATTTSAAAGDAAGVADDPNSPFEKRDTTYRFVGARFRYIVVPKFYMGLFGDGGTTVGVPAFGPEFTMRRNGFEYVFSAMYASYAMDPTPFKAKSDPIESWEIVQTNLKALYLMSDFLWSSEMSPKFAINYGAGFGLAVVLGGNINRQQAQPNGNAGDANSYVPCPPNAAGNGPGPGANGNFCTTENTHYGNYSEPSWADGGSKPIVFPWLSVQTGFRWKPVKQFAARFDIGWNLLNGPFLGLAANYGL